MAARKRPNAKDRDKYAGAHWRQLAKNIRLSLAGRVLEFDDAQPSQCAALIHVFREACTFELQANAYDHDLALELKRNQAE
jgi:hypothetical protein